MKKALLTCLMVVFLSLAVPAVGYAAEEGRIKNEIAGKKEQTAQPQAQPAALPGEGTMIAITTQSTPFSPLSDTTGLHVVAVPSTSESSALYSTSAKPADAPLNSALTTPPGVQVTMEEADLLARINALRLGVGIAPLSLDPTLTQAANVRVQEITTFWSHTRPDGSSWNTVAFGVDGENLAYGPSVDYAILAWMESPGHKMNMLDAAYSRTGLAGTRANGTMYWVQLFGK